MEVAGLLVKGLSNSEIPAMLHISPRTAGHHVTAILTKLGATSRHEVSQAAHRYGIAG